MISNKRFTFSKEESLSLRKEIDQIFERPDFRINRFPLLMLIKIRNESGPVRSLISVPKRKIKSAVRRNLIKRRIKESLRLNKQVLYDVLPENVSLNIAIVYMGNEIASYKDIQKSLISLINDTCKRISKIH